MPQSQASEAGGSDEPGDPAEFAALFEAHHDEVVRLAYLLCGDVELAGDAAAEAFARTYQQWQRGQVGHVPGYVRRVAINYVNSHFRRQARSRRAHIRHGPQWPAGAPSPSEQTIDAQHARWLIRQLPSRQATAIVLRYWQDLSHAEIAEAMDCPLGTVKSLLARGLARLREAAELEDG